MQWVLLGVIVIALLYMSSTYPKFAFGTLGALVVAAAVIVFSTKEDARLGRQQIPVDDIKIENAVITEAYGDSYQFNARLVNANESMLLKESVISITMLDCQDDSEDNCQVIGQSKERINIKIPAGQARDVSENMSFTGAKPVGTVRWKYAITETRS